MAQKKSFFEKLTSSIRFNTDEYETDKANYIGSESNRSMYDDEPEELGTEEFYDEPEVDEDYEEEYDEEIGELSIDMYRTNNAIVVKTMVAGIQKSEIDITLTRDRLVIEGSRTPQPEGSIEDVYFEELYWGAFERSIDLPEEVDIELAEAHESHGLLTLTLPLVDRDRQARLKIK